MTISWITTVLNERPSLDRFFTALKEQTLPPDEVIIVDGGSTDGTFEALQAFAEDSHTIRVRVLQKSGNRAVGRNEAIAQAKGEVIVCTDAGCFPENRWVEEITKAFSDPSVDVVAGYYEAKTETIFQECLVPYVFVMPDKIKVLHFLPATRSMAFTKHIWEKAGKFPEQYDHNEDYVFAHTLLSVGAKIVFHKEAIVYWIPRRTFKEAYTMFYRFALGDAEAGMHRPKVFLVFARYALGGVLLALAIITKSLLLFAVCVVLLVLYVVWAIAKNYRYIDEPPACYYLPALQFTADIAVLNGSVKGWLKRK